MSNATTWPHVRHFNRASMLDRIASNGRPLREMTDEIGRGKSTWGTELQPSKIENNDKENV